MTPGAAGKATTGSTVPSDRGAWPSSATRGFSHQPRGWGLAGQWHRVLQHRRCVGSEWPPLCPGSRPDTCLLGRSGRSSWAHRRPLLSACFVHNKGVTVSRPGPPSAADGGHAALAPRSQAWPQGVAAEVHAGPVWPPRGPLPGSAPLGTAPGAVPGLPPPAGARRPL